jgi:uncharacterized damage-inducible protein DinB
MLALVRRFYGYDTWATDRVLSVAAETAEQLTAEVVAGQPSVRDTLVHLFAAHRVHLDWWSGTLSGEESWARRFAPGDYPDLEAVRAFRGELQRDTDSFLETLARDADLERVLTRTAGEPSVEVRRPLWESMLHVANHSTQHRSEVALMLTALGHSPGDLDLL